MSLVLHQGVRKEAEHSAQTVDQSSRHLSTRHREHTEAFGDIHMNAWIPAPRGGSNAFCLLISSLADFSHLLLFRSHMDPIP